ncbi:DUF1380 family protein [Salmonella enterica]|uniref:DUF1380 family protein n=1 Tax=Salmonella enterica TaxID=28901 RepID=UPI001482E9A2|nr:DUF1380 family protein [Salmonella enterica]
MYGRRIELCQALENMFSPEEPLALLVWTEDSIEEVCAFNKEHPVTEEEIRGVLVRIGRTPMNEYQKKGISAASVSDLLACQRADADRRVEVPVRTLTALVDWAERELTTRESEAWEAGAVTPESISQCSEGIRLLKQLIDA